MLWSRKNDDKSCTYVSDAIWKFVNIPEQKTDQVNIGQFHILILLFWDIVQSFTSSKLPVHSISELCCVQCHTSVMPTG